MALTKIQQNICWDVMSNVHLSLSQRNLVAHIYDIASFLYGATHHRPSYPNYRYPRATFASVD